MGRESSISGSSSGDGSANGGKKTVWSQINWGMVGTWVTLLSTILFNVQFQFIYRNMQQGPLFNTLLTEYSDPTILDSLDLLEDFQKSSFLKHGDELQYI